jgi:hypothetical protein
VLARLTSWRPGQQEVRHSDLTKPKLANYIVIELTLRLKQADTVTGLKNGHVPHRANLMKSKK